jgi:hypothetical protein
MIGNVNIDTCLLRARNVEPAEMPLLGNSSVNMFPQQPNHMIAATDTHATTEDLLEVVFSVPSASAGSKGVFCAVQSKAISRGAMGQANQSGDSSS